jgi:pimeloyl-ACP methyl ester carboxylesterase
MRVARLIPTFFCICTTAFAQQTTDEYYVDRAGDRLHLKVHVPANVRESAPTIVLESGGGFDARQWDALQPELGREFGAVVVAYDRPGFGSSDLPTTSYDIRAEVANLRAALTDVDLASRVVFVAHSYGALLAQLYASLWPETIAGLVFLDPNSAGTMIALHDIQTRPFKTTPPENQRERAFARIDAAIWETLVAVYRSPIPQQIPLIVVSAEQGFFPEERQIEAFRLTHKLLALSVTNGQVVVAEGSNHMIPAQRPDIVVSSVRTILEAAPFEAQPAAAANAGTLTEPARYAAARLRLRP